MEQLIPVYNKLQEIFASCRVKLDIDLPRIVVVGSQSAGKSSVLESLVGRDFLPRGTGIVTRRPLVLQLVNHPEEYALFNETKKFTNFDAVRQEIINDTQRVCQDKQISNEPILLRIFSPNVITLSLVDLPGIVANRLPGQPADIVERVKKMVVEYIKAPNTIILAVTPANVDIATSDSLSIARTVDPEGKRTIGVLTKLDLMDRGTSAANVLNGTAYPLALGYVGVICRGQADIDDNMSFERHLKNEEKFFKQNRIYGEYGSSQGTPFLRRRLSSILLSHIKKLLPSINSKVNHDLAKTKEELEHYGPGASELDLPTAMHTEISHFQGALQESIIRGSVASKINQELNYDLIKKLVDVDALGNLSEEKLMTFIRNSNGYQGSMFIPQHAFVELLTQAIPKLAPACIATVDDIANTMRQAVSKCRHDQRSVFPALYEKLNRLADKCIDSTLSEVKALVNDFIEIEASYINIHNPDFIHGYTILNQLMPRTEVGQDRAVTFNLQDMSDIANKLELYDKERFSVIFDIFTKGPSDTNKTKVTCNLINGLTRDYLSIVLKSLTNYVPKAIVTLLIEETLNMKLKNECSKLGRAGDATLLMREDPKIEGKRGKCRAVIAVLEEAAVELRRIERWEDL
mmetsp:Transcript_32623/g.56664  ORF Transcript_32623/g.56664 Transcript_32623/m.56664 type:complete len:633 (-) Transcript_32623:50-1948(-)